MTLIGSSGLSNLADGIYQITLPLLALTVTRDPAAFASVAFFSRLPWLLVALPAGVLADRLDRRRTMVVVNISRALMIGALAAFVGTGLQSLWPLYVAAFTLGIAETLFDTAAQSILPTVVEDPERLSLANGRLHATELIANQFIGPPLGALLVGVALAGALITSSATYLVAAAALATMTGRHRPHRPGPRTPLRTDLVDGVRYLVHHRLLRVLGLCVGISNLASTGMIAILPLYVIAPGTVALSAAGYGLLLVTIAAGQVSGTALTPMLERRLGPKRTMLFATAGFPLFSLGPALTANPVWLAAVFFAAGAVSISWNIITVSVRQRIVPNSMLGRVNAGYRLVAWGTIPLGAALGGLVAHRYGLTTTFWVATAISATCFPLIAFGTSSDDLAAGRQAAIGR